MNAQPTYPFGRAVHPRPPSASTPRPLFVLGAYPSALHVQWRPAAGRLVRAIPVDDEPHPFWNGADAQERVAAWLDWLRPSPSKHGTFSVPPRLNGPSGSWVDDNIMRPLGYEHRDACITDCLDTYRMSVGVEARICDTYMTSGLPPCDLASHPSESDIVSESLGHHRDRLLHELGRCHPKIVATLGNAAARVFASIVALPQSKLSIIDYGRPRRVALGDRTITWYPLAHPAAPKVYQEAHTTWVANQKRCN